MARYLVTGLAGFIGGAVGEALLKNGNEVVGIDNFSTGFLESIPKKAKCLHANVQDKELYLKSNKDLYEKPFDAIIHIAGQSSGEISFDDPIYDLETNTSSTLRLLKFAKATGCKQIIYASTMSVYGHQPDVPVKEDSTTFPLSFYGVGKLASENYLRIYEDYGINSTALRLFNVYGEGQNMGNLRQGMVSIFMAMMVNNNHIHIKGSPSRFRDFVYISDVVDAFLSCINNPNSYGKVLNIGTGVKTSVEELIDKLTAIHSKKVTVEFSGSTPGDMNGIVADISSAKKHLNYSPKIDLESGLRAMYSWYINSIK